MEGSGRPWEMGHEQPSMDGSRAPQWQGAQAEPPLGKKSTPLWDLSNAIIWRVPDAGGGARVWEKCQGWTEIVPAAREGLSLKQSLDLRAPFRREQKGVRESDPEQKGGLRQHRWQSQSQNLGWAPAAGCREAAGVRVGCPVQHHFPTSCPLTLLLRPKDGPCRDQPLGNVHSMELGPVTTGEPSPRGE